MRPVSPLPNQLLWSRHLLIIGTLILSVLAVLLLAVPGSADAGPRKSCVYSPTRGWEYDKGGKDCRRKTLRFFRVAKVKLGMSPALNACETRRPKKIWRCTSSRHRTMNVQGDYLKGRFIKSKNGWKLVGLHFPAPNY